MQRRHGRRRAGPSARQTIENLWAYLRANFLSHRVWDGYDAIVDACCHAWNALMRMPEQVTSITTRTWARVNVQGVALRQAMPRLMRRC